MVCIGNSIGDAGCLAATPPTAATMISAGISVNAEDYPCAVLDNGGMRCWGVTLGYGNTNVRIGDDEPATVGGFFPVGGRVMQVAAGGAFHGCALLETGTVRCWGYGFFGRLGYGNTSDIGDNEAAGAGGDVDVGGAVAQVATGGAHSCALLDSGAVRCWGLGERGQLGYGNTNNIGDDETPASAGDVPLF